MKRIKSFDNTHPLIYLIATPIGNLKEFTPRAVEIIQEMDYIACEDTRNSKSLLNKFNIDKRLISLREHNEVEASLNVIKDVKQGKKVAYMSDAGYPAISDPGNILVKLAIENDIAISVISGASAFINALTSSNMDTNHFYFHGFLSAKESEARKELDLLKNKEETLIFYESPHRIQETMKILYEVLDNRDVVLHRELTKINEEKIYGTLKELQSLDYSTIKGEIVIVISGNKCKDTMSEEEVLSKINYFLKYGIDKKTAVEIVSDLYNIKKNYIKDLLLRKEK